jgi:hypothetical protein
MTKILMVLSAVAVLFASVPCRALTYNFSFDGQLGTVTGEIDGLAAGYNGPASAIFIDRAPLGFILQAPAEFFASTNNFAVDAAGNITSYDLFAGYQAYIQLRLSSTCLSCNFLDQDPLTNIAQLFPTFSAAPTSTTPIPASAPLFATILGLVALMAYWRKGRIRTNLKAVQRFA